MMDANVCLLMPKCLGVQSTVSFVKDVNDSVFSSEVEEVRYEYKSQKNIQNVVRFTYNLVIQMTS